MGTPREHAVAALELARDSLLFGVVVIGARSNRIQDLRPLVGQMQDALARVQAGNVSS